MLVKGNSIIKIRNLTLAYEGDFGTIIAIDDLSLDIPEGKITSIVGESGSGKSTLANSLIGFLKYPLVKISGSVYFHEDDIYKLSDSKLSKLRMKDISFVPQAAMNSLNPVIKIGEEIHDIISAHMKVSETEERQIISEALKIVELPEYVLDSYQNQISGGMRQRVMIAIASLMNPEVIILDEPTTGLDVIVQKEILDTVKKINIIRGTTIILITHDLPVAFYLSDYISILYAGKVVEDGLKEELIKNKLHPYTELLIGSIPSLNSNKMRLLTIPGEVNPIFEPEKKCTFVKRCPQAFKECKTLEMEDFLTMDELVRCQKYNPSLIGKIGNSSTISGQDTYKKEKREHNFLNKLVNENEHELKLVDLHVNFVIGRGSNKKIIEAVNGVTVEVSSGKASAIVGASGSGKTTLGKIMLFDETPTSGKFLFDGEDVTKANNKKIKELRSHIQMIFQDPFSSLSPIHKIGYQIERPLIINKISSRETVKEDVLELLNLVGLRPSETFIHKFPYELSGGQRQRVCIAKALSVGAKILVADEPVSMLDASVRAEILNLLVDLKNELNLGLLYITHDLSTVKYLSDMVYVMHNGKVEESGDWKEVFENPKAEYTKQLIQSIV